MPWLRRPALLVPEGPPPWGSFWQIQPVIERSLRRIGARIERHSAFAPYRGPVLDSRTSSAWIVSYGGLSLGGLRLAQGIQNGLAGASQLARPPLWIMSNGEGSKGCLHLLAAHRMLRPDDQIIVLCRAEERLVREAFPGSRPRVSPLAVDTRVFRPLSERARRAAKARLGLGPRDPLVVYAGRISSQKNVLGLIEAFARVRRRHSSAQLVVLGQPDPIHLPHIGRPFGENLPLALARRVSELQMDGAVRFAGSVGQRDLATYLGACDLQASLTVHFGEDFGYSIAQGIACGAPTVVTRWGGGDGFVAARAALGVQVEFGARDATPRVDIALAARRMLEALASGKAGELRERAAAYGAATLSEQAFAERWSGWLREKRRRPQSFEPSARAKWFLAEQESRWKSGGPEADAPFTGPRDPYYRRICAAYAGRC